MTRWLLALIFAFGTVTFITGCEDDSADDAADAIGDAADDAADAADDAVDDAGDAIDDATDGE